jgi:hypothetical protein
LTVKRYADVTGIATNGNLVYPPAAPALYQMLDIEWGEIGPPTHGSTLFGSACGVAGSNEQINVPVPNDFKLTRIRLVSRMGCSTQIEQATPVLRIEPNGAAGPITSLNFEAGRDTAEWAFERPDVQKVIRHARAPVAESFDAAGVMGHWYEAMPTIPAHAAPIQSLTVRGLLTDAFLDVRDMTLIDDTTGRHIDVPISALRAVQPPNWEAMVPTATGGYLAKFRKSLGRAWLVGEVRHEAPPAIREVVHDGRLPDGTPFDPARLAFVEEAPPALGPAAGGSGRVETVALRPGHWVFDVTTPAPAFLVISQTNYPGWQVRVNDEPARLYQTNYAFQGVAVPAGHSRVVLEFRPLSLYLGGAISLAAIALSGALLLWGCRHRLRRWLPLGQASRSAA